MDTPGRVQTVLARQVNGELIYPPCAVSIYAAKLFCCGAAGKVWLRPRVRRSRWPAWRGVRSHRITCQPNPVGAASRSCKNVIDALDHDPFTKYGAEDRQF